MGKIAFLFPGQGAQFVGMGKDLYEKYDEIKSIYNLANEVLNFDVADLTFNSNEEELSKTENTQIAIFLMSMGIVEILKKQGIKPNFSAGLSLGEYSALTQAGVFTIEDAIKIVKKRGEIMANNLPDGYWAMAAIIGADDSEVEKLCKSIENGFAVPANYNCPGQVAISGDRKGIDEAISKAKEFGARKAIELKTSGPFHTEKLNKASILFKNELDLVNINNNFENVVIKNIDATEYSKDDDIKTILAKHIMNPVKFSKSIKYMLDKGVDTFIEIGPGKVLSGFVKKVDRNVNVLNVQDIESLENVLTQLNENN